MKRRAFVHVAAKATAAMAAGVRVAIPQGAGVAPTSAGYSSLAAWAAHMRTERSLSSSGGFLVPVQYAEEIAAHLKASCHAYLREEMQRLEREMINGVGGGEPVGLIGGGE